MEMWRPVVGREGLYEVSSEGRVRSVDRVVVRSDGVSRRFPGVLLKPQFRPDGHTQVAVGVGRMRKVHSLVLEAFAGPRPDSMEALHGNGDAADNRIENLRWGTKSENMLDRVKHGTHHNASKLECKNGHPFTVENTKPHTAGVGRKCRECERAAKRRYRARLRVAA